MGIGPPNTSRSATISTPPLPICRKQSEASQCRVRRSLECGFGNFHQHDRSVTTHRRAGRQAWKKPRPRWKRSRQPCAKMPTMRSRPISWCRIHGAIASRGGSVVMEAVTAMARIEESLRPHVGYHLGDRRNRPADQSACPKRCGGSGALQERPGVALRWSRRKYAALPSAPHRRPRTFSR